MLHDSLAQQIVAHLDQVCCLNFTRIVVVGVSGGPDSLCLMHLLHQAGYPVLVAHLDHGLRPESAAEAAHVSQYAQSLGLTFVSQAADVRAYAQENNLSIEEAARNLRYSFLFEQAAAHHAQAVAVGHTADDQAETVLMHFLRGSGLAGLKGMSSYWLPNAWSTDIPLVRPLLTLWRADTLGYCRENNLPYVQDATNQDPAYFRNRLRHEVIPYLEGLNPALRASLLRMAQALQSDQAIVEAAVQAAWKRCAQVQQADAVAFSLPTLEAEPVEMQRQLIRRALGLSRPGLRDIDFDSVQRAVEALTSPPQSGECDLLAGMRLLFEPGLVWIAAWEADLPRGNWPHVEQETLVGLPAEVNLPDGWVLKAARLEMTAEEADQAQDNPDPYQAFLDLSSLSLPISVRPRQPGDRFQPLGFPAGTQKISDYFINRKLPRRARAAWPLVCSAGQVAWVPGYALAHPFRITSATREAVWLRLLRG